MLDLGEFLTQIRGQNPILGLALEQLQDSVNHLGVVTGNDSTGLIEDAPTPPQALQVSAGGGILHATVTDTSARSRPLNYFLEVDTDPAFPQPHMFATGAGREALLSLPNKDSSGNQLNYYARAYSMLPGSARASDAVVFGGAANPTAIQVGGGVSLTLQDAPGGGTASASGMQGGEGFGPTMLTPEEPTIASQVAQGANSGGITPGSFSGVDLVMPDEYVVSESASGGIETVTVTWASEPAGLFLATSSQSSANIGFDQGTAATFNSGGPAEETTVTTGSLTPSTTPETALLFDCHSYSGSPPTAPAAWKEIVTNADSTFSLWQQNLGTLAAITGSVTGDLFFESLGLLLFGGTLSFVQNQAASDPESGGTLEFSDSVTKGNTIMVVAVIVPGNFSPAPTVPTISDSLSNVFTNVFSSAAPANLQMSHYVFLAPIATGGSDTVTITFSGEDTSIGYWQIWEVQGITAVETPPSFRAITTSDLQEAPASTSELGAIVLAGDLGNTAESPEVLSTHLTSPLPVAQGGSGSASPSLLAGANISISGSWPDQTVAATGLFVDPMTTKGDIIYENSTPAPARLAIGTSGQVLTVSGGLPAWENASSGGTVTEVTFPTTPSWLTASVADDTTTPEISLTATSGLTENEFLATPNGSSGAVSLRAIVLADLPAQTGTGDIVLATAPTISAPVFTGSIVTAKAPLNVVTDGSGYAGESGYDFTVAMGSNSVFVIANASTISETGVIFQAVNEANTAHEPLYLYASEFFFDNGSGIIVSFENGAVIGSGTDQGLGTINVQNGYYIGNTAGVSHASAGVSAMTLSGGIVTAFTASSSDERLKENIKPLSSGLDEIEKLNPVSFNFNTVGQEELNQTDRTFNGFIAQEVAAVLPDAKLEHKWLDFDDRAVIAALVNAVKELANRIKILESMR